MPLWWALVYAIPASLLIWVHQEARAELEVRATGTRGVHVVEEVAFYLGLVAVVATVAHAGPQWLNGWAARRRKQRCARVAADAPHWQRDHAWPRLGEHNRELRMAELAFAGFLAALAVVPLIWMGATSRVPAALTWGICCLLAAALSWGVLRMTTGGVIRLTYDAPPYSPQAPITLRLGKTDGSLWADGLNVRLRCVTLVCPRSVWEWLRSHWALWPRGASQNVRSRPLGSDRTEVCHWDVLIVVPRRELPVPGSDVEVTFDPPPGLPGTHLAADEPTVWEVHLWTTDTAKDDQATFLVPVYDESRERR